MSVFDKLKKGTSYPDNIAYLGDKPNFTRDSFDTLEEMDEAIELGFIDEGHLSYCKADGVHYKATKTDDGGLEWKPFKPGDPSAKPEEGGSVSLAIFTPTALESIPEPDRPEDYILIHENSPENINARVSEQKFVATREANGTIEGYTYTEDDSGHVLDMMFKALRSLQSKVARLENTFDTGIVSMTDTETAASTVIPGPEVEEQEPLWAIDPEDLTEIEDTAIRLTSPTDLTPSSSVAFWTEPARIELQGEASKELSGKLDFDASEESKQVMYITMNPKPGFSIKVKLGYWDPDNNTSVTPTDGPTIVLDKDTLPQQKLNIMLMISRKSYDEDSEEYSGKNYIWLSVTNTQRQELLGKYFGENLVTMSDYEESLDKRYFIQEVTFNHMFIYRCNFYAREQSYTNISNIPPQRANIDEFVKKAAHITLRSVKTYATLETLKSRLFKNELVWVEEKEQLYIIAGDNKTIYTLGSGGGSGGPNDSDDMTNDELLAKLTEMGLVTAKGEINSVKLNNIEKLTFIHTESGQEFDITVDSKGNFVPRPKVTIQKDEGNKENTGMTFRGAVAYYNMGKVDFVKSENKLVTGTSRDIKALGDRVRFGAWYMPVKGQTDFNCSHDFIEIVNSGTTDYPLESAVLIVLKATQTTYTPSGKTAIWYLSDASLDVFHLTGTIKAGSSYLVRAKERLLPGDPRIHVNVESYDYELWIDGKEYSLEGVLGLVLLHKEGLDYDGGFKLKQATDLNPEPVKPLYYVPKLYETVDNHNFFNAKVNPFLIDVITLGDMGDTKNKVKHDSFRSSDGKTRVWGDSYYDISARNAIVKDEFALDPAKQAFRSLTSEKETSKYRMNNIQQEIVPLGDDVVSFYHSTQTYPVAKFTPKASKENKNVCTDKTSLDYEKPNMVTVSFGIDMSNTRCFNWISVGTFDEYIWIRRKNSGDTTWHRFESYKAGDGKESWTAPTGVEFCRKEFTAGIINAAYKRITGSFPGAGTPYCAHKCIIQINDGPILDTAPYKAEYEYIVGRSLKNGNPNLAHCSKIQSFALHNPGKFTPVVYHITDQQGFGWMEYQVWSAAAENLLNKIKSDYSQGGTFPVLINTGDMTQNGTRINEWLDYYEGGVNLFDHLEQMNCVGNNDLGNGNDHSALGTGNDEGKSSPYFYNLFYCYEVDPEMFSEAKGGWTHPLIYNGVYLPSTYYFYSGGYAYLSVNSELTVEYSIAELGSPDSSSAYNPYTGYTVGDPIHTINYSDSTDWSLAKTINDILEKLSSKITIVYCHEMPYTVITNDYLSKTIELNNSDVLASTLDRCCNYSSEKTKSSLIGSHLNRFSQDDNFDGDDNYWFSRLLDSHKIRLCIGGHKHSYTATWPVIEGTSEIKELFKSNETFKNYDISKLFITIVSDEYYDLFTTINEDSVGPANNYPLYFKPVNKVDKCYPLIMTTNRKYNEWKTKKSGDTSNKYGVTYFMCQATGYKLKSNKELPSINQIYSIVVPKTNVTDKKPHFSQESPMYVVYTYGTGVINCDLYRVVNIKQTGTDKITEFSETSYSTYPMVAEKLLINLKSELAGIYFYDNVWYTEAPVSSYSFNYRTASNTDRCWKEGNTIKLSSGGTANLYNSTHTLIVNL